MRVIAGEKRGLKLKAPDGMNTRPTTDRIKESLFNILAPLLYEAYFLDLFSGSGGVGIEAISRGAKKAVFADRDEEACRIINENIKRAGFESRSLVIKADFYSALKKTAALGYKFDVIFMDPPYYSDFFENILDEIKILGILNNKGIVVAEQAKNEPEIKAGGFKVFRIKEYGKTTKISFLKSSEE